jgi:hypothetical protein
LAGPKETFPCPACGEDVPVGRPSCAACGADERTGWKPDDEERVAQELDLPRPDVDDEEYDDFVATEFGGERPYESRGGGGRGLVLILGGIVVLGLLLWLLQSSPKR